MNQVPARVSIGIPTYNRASLVGRAIESALAQDYPEIELIVSDNASTDATEEECRRRAGRDARLRYVRQAQNIGATLNFEEVLRLATGEYFMWLGDDDWIDADYVRQCLSELVRERGAALVGGVPRYYNKGVDSGLGQRLSLMQSAWWMRVFSYYWQVRDNGIFYGIARTAAMRDLLPISNVMGGDWLHVAALAAQGEIRTIDATQIHREMGGATASYDQIARALRLNPMAGRFPFSFIAGAAFTNIAWRNGGYDGRGRIARWALALAVAAGLMTRGAIHGPSSIRRACRRALSAVSIRARG